jgi:hypothetical protein
LITQEGINLHEGEWKSVIRDDGTFSTS